MGILLSFFFWRAKYWIIRLQIMFIQCQLETFIFALGKQHGIFFRRHKYKLRLNELFQALLALLTDHVQVVVVHSILNNMDETIWFKNTPRFLDLAQNAFF